MHRRNIGLVGILDQYLPSHFNNCNDVTDMHSVLYCGIVAVCRVAGVQFPNKRGAKGQASEVHAICDRSVRNKFKIQ